MTYDEISKEIKKEFRGAKETVRGGESVIKVGDSSIEIDFNPQTKSAKFISIDNGDIIIYSSSTLQHKVTPKEIVNAIKKSLSNKKVKKLTKAQLKKILSNQLSKIEDKEVELISNDIDKLKRAINDLKSKRIEEVIEVDGNGDPLLKLGVPNVL